MVYSRSPPRSLLSMRALLSKCGIPVSRSALATEVNSRCGSRASCAAEMIASPWATSCSGSASNGVVTAKADAAPRMALASAAASERSAWASSIPRSARATAPRDVLSRTRARTRRLVSSSAVTTAPPWPPVAPKTTTGRGDGSVSPVPGVKGSEVTGPSQGLPSVGLLDVEGPDLAVERGSADAQATGGALLVAARCGERGDHGVSLGLLHLPQVTVRAQDMTGQVRHRDRIRAATCATCAWRTQSGHQMFELGDVAGPGV